MPLPSGFKVNGLKTEDIQRMALPPRVKTVIALLEKLPVDELMTTLELATRLGMLTNGNTFSHPVLRESREKIDNRLYWGSRKSIKKLRAQLIERGGPREN